MLRGLGLVTALALVVPCVRGWLRALRPYTGGVRIVRSRTNMSSSLTQAINVEELWPNFAGKKTSASDAAGKVIREAWARDQSKLYGIVGDTSSSSSSPSSWNIRRSVVDYKDDAGTALQGLYARPEREGHPDRLPGVILAHTAVGPQEDMILWKLDAIARLGYAAFALDMFGTGQALWDRSQSLAARRPITEDRSLLQARAMAAIRTLSQMEEVDEGRLAAVGYCFGGMAVLDVARMARGDVEGDDDAGATRRLKAVASLHGILAPILPGAACDVPDDAPIGVPRVLVLHASADPFVPPEQVQAMEAEFLHRGANLEVVRYGGEALHAFTRPEKTSQADKDAGLSYCKHADEDSWRRVVDLLREELS